MVHEQKAAILFYESAGGLQFNYLLQSNFTYNFF